MTKIISKLFDPLQVGPTNTTNRIYCSPCTRCRATKEFVPTPIMVEYYRQRATSGLIITEATGISQQGLGTPFAPGIWNDEQVAGWKLVTEAVHKAGGQIVVQLWHMGRLVHPSFNNGEVPVSASAQCPYDYSETAQNANPFRYARTYEGRLEYAVPRPATKEDIVSIVNDYRVAARNAILAGFDGVQIHAANGFLIDQFLRDGSNKRTDEYGGSIENRIRLLVEVTNAVVGEIGAERTGVRLSPNGEVQGTNDSNPHELFPAAAKALADIGVAFLELREPNFNGTYGKADVAPVAPSIRKVYKGVLILNADYDFKKAEETVNNGVADAISFGRKYIANPDLVERFEIGAPLNKDNMATWYGAGGASTEGYIDYPFYSK